MQAIDPTNEKHALFDILIDTIGKIPVVLNAPDGSFKTITLAEAQAPIVATAKEVFSELANAPEIARNSPAVTSKIVMEIYAQINVAIGGKDVTPALLHEVCDAIRNDYAIPDGESFINLVNSIPYWEAVVDPLPLGLVSYPEQLEALEGGDLDLEFVPDGEDDPAIAEDTGIKDDELSEERSEEDGADYPDMLADEMDQPVTLHQTVETERRLKRLMELAEENTLITPDNIKRLSQIKDWLIARDRAQISKDNGKNLYTQDHDLSPTASASVLFSAIARSLDADISLEQRAAELTPGSHYLQRLIEREIARNPDTEIDRSSTHHLKTIAGAKSELKEPEAFTRQ